MSPTDRARCCAGVAISGEFVGLAEDLDFDAPMRVLPASQQRVVEGRVLEVERVWITVGYEDGPQRWGCDYSFDGILGRFPAHAFVDAPFHGSCYGVLLPHRDQLWFVPAKGRNWDSTTWTFHDPIQIDGLERCARHSLIGSTTLDGNCDDWCDLQNFSGRSPAWGEAVLGRSGDLTLVLQMHDFEVDDPSTVAELISTIEGSSPRM